MAWVDIYWDLLNGLKMDGINASQFCSQAGGAGLLLVLAGCLQQNSCRGAKAVIALWQWGCVPACCRACGPF